MILTIQYCPIRFSAMMEIVKYVNHQPHVTTEHLEYGECDQGTIKFYSLLFK